MCDVPRCSTVLSSERKGVSLGSLMMQGRASRGPGRQGRSGVPGQHVFSLTNVTVMT